MSERRFAQSIIVAVIWASASASSTAFARQGVSLNGPLELADTIRQVEEQANAGPTAQRRVEAAASQPEATAKAEQPSQATVFVPPVHESKPLGKPDNQSPLNGTVEKSDGKSASSRWDPRQSEFTRVLGALAAVIGLLLVVKTCIRRFGNAGILGNATSRPSGVIEILARYPLGARGQQLVVLKLARRILLLHQNGSAMNTLTEIDDQHEVAGLLSRMEAGSSDRNAAKFRHALAEFMQDNSSCIKTEKALRTRTALPKGEAEIIDLTRRQGGFLRTLFGGRSL